MNRQRASSPSRNRRMHQNTDPYRASTGTLPDPYHDHYYAPAPSAPAPPHRTPHSTNPHSPRSSGESLGYQGMPYFPQGHPGGPGLAGPPGSHPPPPSSAPGMPHDPSRPVSSMRGGDGTHGRPVRRNTLSSANRPIIHNYSEYDYTPTDYGYNNPAAASQLPILHPQKSRSSSRTRDVSPPSSGEQYTMIPGPGGAPSRHTAYHPGSSSYSASSFPENERQKEYIVSSASRHGRGNGREYHLNGPLPGEREHRREGGRMYHPSEPSRPVVDEPRRERSMSRGPTGRTPLAEYGVESSEEEDESEYETDYEDARRPASAGTGPPGNSSALIRPRSRSVSRSRKSTSGAMVPHRKDDAKPPGGIRLEYGGNSFDITYTDAGGKPLSIGSITINTTSRTTAVPISGPSSSSTAAIMVPPPSNAIAAPPSNAIAAPPSNAIAALPAPPAPAETQRTGVAPVVVPAIPPPQAPTLPPPGIAPVLLPPPPPPPPMALPPIGPIAMPVDPARESLYRSMANMAIEDRPPSDDYMGHTFHSPLGSPLGQPHGSPMSLDERGREFERGQLGPMVRRRSRSAGASHDPEPRWTKISRDIVARRAVEVFGYNFEEHSDSIIIFQVLNEAEIDDLIDLSERIRNGEIRVIRREREPEPRPAKSTTSSHRRRSKHRRPLSIHGPSAGPGPSANRPPPNKPAIVQNSNSGPAPPPAPELPTTPPIMDAPAPPPQAPAAPKGSSLTENPGLPGTYVGYVRKPPPSSYGPYK
ncbi:hypothetical protein RUND412_009471 [Rhizina undulata]